MLTPSLDIRAAPVAFLDGVEQGGDHAAAWAVLNSDGAGRLLRLESPADLDPAHVGHHSIKQNQIRFLGHDLREGFLPGVGGHDRDRLPFQFAFEQLHVDRLLVDHENLGGCHQGREWGFRAGTQPCGGEGKILRLEALMTKREKSE